MLYYAMGVYVHAAYCIRVLVLYSRTWRAVAHPTSHTPDVPFPGSRDLGLIWISWISDPTLCIS